MNSLIAELSQWLHDGTGLAFTHLLAGAFGGGTNSVLLKIDKIAPILRAIVIGAATGAYLGPGMAEWVGMAVGSRGEISVVFAAGLTGMSLAEGLLLMMRRWSSNPTWPPGGGKP